jgi:alkylation response protein AidB-like acyl-CoA dehydrogenase
MSERDLVGETARKIFADNCSHAVVEAAEGSWAQDLWSHLEAVGLTAVGIREIEGGSGGDLSFAAEIVMAAAESAAPLPIAETLVVAPWLRREFGRPHRGGPVTVATGAQLSVRRDGDQFEVTGELGTVPWGRCGFPVLAIADCEGTPALVELLGEEINWTSDTNLAGEPRDFGSVSASVATDRVTFGCSTDAIRERLFDQEALGKAALMVGALRSVRDLAIRYSKERIQFGRPLSAFQAVRQMGAVLAGEVAVAEAATFAALDASALTPSPFPVAAARVRTAEAASNASRIAHQMHGAMGFTREHALHHFTRRLWSWRDEGRTESHWAQIAGQRALAAGPNAIWETMVGEL